MSKGSKGMVGADGQSVLPAGIMDLAGMGEQAVLDPKAEERLQAALQGEGLGEKQKQGARYKLEIALTENRSFHKPFAGIISAWSNGGFASGGGDEVIYFCPAETEDGACEHPLDLAWIGKEMALCPKCRTPIEPKKLTGQIFARLTMQNWTKLIYHYFRLLSMDADLRIGVLAGDLRQASIDDIEHGGGDNLLRSRMKREWVIYPLANIIKDTSTGASLPGRIRAFLQA